MRPGPELDARGASPCVCTTVGSGSQVRRPRETLNGEEGVAPGLHGLADLREMLHAARKMVGKHRLNSFLCGAGDCVEGLTARAIIGFSQTESVGCGSSRGTDGCDQHSNQNRC